MIALPWTGRKGIEGVREAKTDGGSVRSTGNLPKLLIFFHMK
jgi:hypothetical protein